MDKKYEDWNKLFCDELCEEISKFECTHKREYLCGIKELIEVINGLQEMEMDGAIRRIAEDHYGYDSGTGRFRKDGMERFGRDAEMEFIEMFNAARGRGRGRRRDSRGRFIGNMADPRYMPPYYPDMDEGDYLWERPYYMMNDGKREYSADRFKRDGERSRDGMDKDDGMYMLRQKDGMPIMTPYNAHDPHDIPKKLTKEQCEEWMAEMDNADGSYGKKYDEKQVEEAAKRLGIDYQEYGLETLLTCTNIMFSDYVETAQKYGVNKIDFFVSLADDFLEDSDFPGKGGGKEKLSIYYHAIANAKE